MELSVVSATLVLSLQEFLTATENCFEFHDENYDGCDIEFVAMVSPNADEDWISVRVLVNIDPYRRNLGLYNFKWAVSIIDIEGRTRFTRYFANSSNNLVSGYGSEDRSKSMSLPRFFENPSIADDRIVESRYMEKSFIRSRADEFLSDGTLFLSCDIFFDFDAIKDFVYIIDKPLQLCDTDYIPFLKPPWSFSDVKADKTGKFSGPYLVFDYTSQIVTLPQFHELRKKFGVYGISPKFEPPSSLSEEEITDILEHVWIFDIRDHRFLLSLDPNKKNLGRLLVDASPVIRQCIKAPMKEQREKRIEFPDVDSGTFLKVLQLLTTREVNYPSDAIVEVYKFSHLYEMENLQQICAEQIIRDSLTETELEEIEKIAELYSDDYLFKLLQSRKREISKPADTFVKDYRHNFECFF